MLLDRVTIPLWQAEKKNGLAIFLGPHVAKAVAVALNETKRHERRRRDLSATLMVYVVLAMTFYRSLSVPNVFRQLFSGATLGLPGGRRTVAESSIVAARYRLGPEPMKHLFETLAAQVVPRATFHSYRVHAMDGVRFPVADTPENEKEFGRPKSGRGRTARPVVRVVTLASAYSHEVEGINISGWKTPEQDAVEELITGLGERDVVLLDRLYPSGHLFLMFQSNRVQVVARINARWKPRIVRTLGVGDFIVEVEAKIALTPEEQAVRPRKGRPTKWKRVVVTMRMITYTCGAKENIRLLTTLPRHIPALDIARLYHERWEIELVNDEIKNHLATPLHGTEQLCFRSRFPNGVKQEIYGAFAAHLLLRQTMRTTAETYGIHPLRISLTDSLNTIRRFLPLLQFASADMQGLLLGQLYQQIALDCQLRTRRNRQYARKVRVKMSDFKCKTRADIQTKIDHFGQTKLANPAPGLALRH